MTIQRRSTRYPPEEYVATSVSTAVLAMSNAAHRRGGIAVISGPPGVGKSKAITELCRALPGESVVVRIGGKENSATLLGQFVAKKLRDISGLEQNAWVPAGRTDLAKHMFASLCAKANVNIAHARQHLYPREAFGSMTIVVDEAQSLSRNAIEVARFWNDPDHEPMPFGLVFIGNSEFALDARGGEQSVLSAAVADRTAYEEQFTYDDVLDNDLILYADARGVTDDGARDAMLDFFKPGGRANGIRSLRKLGQAIDDAIEDAVDDDIGSDLLSEKLHQVMRLRLSAA